MRLIYFVLLLCRDGIWSGRSCVDRRTTPPPLGIQFCAALPNRAIVVSCLCCSLFRSQRSTCTGVLLTVPQSEVHLCGTPPDSGNVRACPESPGTIPGYCIDAVASADCPCCSQPIPAVPGPQARPGARFRGLLPFLRFLLMELMELIWDSVLVIFEDQKWSRCRD